jgi:hypothetical protein
LVFLVASFLLSFPPISYTLSFSSSFLFVYYTLKSFFLRHIFDVKSRHFRKTLNSFLLCFRHSTDCEAPKCIFLAACWQFLFLMPRYSDQIRKEVILEGKIIIWRNTHASRVSVYIIIFVTIEILFSIISRYDIRATVAQSVHRLATSWSTERSEFESS